MPWNINVLERVLNQVGTNSTGNSGETAADETTASLLSGETSDTASDEGCTEATVAVLALHAGSTTGSTAGVLLLGAGVLAVACSLALAVLLLLVLTVLLLVLLVVLGLGVGRGAAVLVVALGLAVLLLLGRVGLVVLLLLGLAAVLLLFWEGNVSAERNWDFHGEKCPRWSSTNLLRVALLLGITASVLLLLAVLLLLRVTAAAAGVVVVVVSRHDGGVSEVGWRREAGVEKCRNGLEEEGVD